MKTILRLEELGIFGLALFLFVQTSFGWWWLPLLILTPDIGMAGYLASPGTGAVIYNLFHHRGMAVLLYLIGYIWEVPWVELAGIILLAHTAMDRMLGYGLKYPDNFWHTHLGHIARSKK